MPNDDANQDDRAALNFFNTHRSDSDDNASGGLQALKFSAAGHDRGQNSAVAGLTGWAPTQPEDTTTDLDAIRSAARASTQNALKQADFLAKVTNPPGTVSVTALHDGSVLQIDLSPKVTTMTESALANEILAIADLARQKGLADQQAFIVDAMAASGLDDPGGAHERILGSLDLPTPQQAEAAQAELFAARYAAGTD
jgi:hypothetical protein